MKNTKNSTRTLTVLALLIAMSIVFSWVLSISTGFVRFNLGSLPVLLAGAARLAQAAGRRPRGIWIDSWNFVYEVSKMVSGSSCCRNTVWNCMEFMAQYDP